MDYNGTSVPRRVAWIDTNNSTEYHDVTTSIMLRKEKPYKVLSDPGRSAVTVSLHLPSGVSDIAVTLNHCSTSDEVRIYFQVNSEFLYRSYHVASSDDFSEHTFRVPLNTIKIGNNKMVLGLNEGSQGEYLLSDLNIRTGMFRSYM
ncbi:uncharacterized protein LOC134231829 [Saccostrea cucullata]|uniref:uncharacterized protein LOC134231829 n=1 Tax=Saccostrea cuccullata TaxID=36930 RepID=UPI002ED37976